MTAARDARGRFANPDVAAAERVLEAAVEEAVALLSSAPVPEKPDGWLAGIRKVSRVRAEQVLAHAGHAADLLLERAS
jgi:hypothetical protein